MATALQLQAPGPVPSVGKDSSHWLQTTATPRSEARNLFALVGKNGNTVDSIRELIAVPPLIEHALGLYARRFPEDAPAIEKVLRFRTRVREEFDRLVNTSQKPAPVALIEPETSDRAEDAVES